MTETLTRNTIVELYQTLATRGQGKFNPKFSFFLIRNVKYLEEEIKIIDEPNEKLREVRDV